jgi:hypothetical protein
MPRLAKRLKAMLAHSIIQPAIGAKSLFDNVGRAQTGLQHMS